MKQGQLKRIAAAFAIVALAAVGTVTGASAQNILVNGDFETGDLTGWVVAGGNMDATVSIQSPDNGPSMPGTNNAYLSNFGQALGLTLKQTTPPGSIAGGEVTYSFDLKLDQADVGGVLFAEVFAEQSGVGIVGGSGLQGPYWPWNVWQSFSGSFIAPETADFITIQFVAVTGAAEGTNCVAHVDNVSVEGQGAVPTQQSSWSNVKALFR
jgi:hypothetical protein